MLRRHLILRCKTWNCESQTQVLEEAILRVRTGLYQTILGLIRAKSKGQWNWLFVPKWKGETSICPRAHCERRNRHVLRKDDAESSLWGLGWWFRSKYMEQGKCGYNYSWSSKLDECSIWSQRSWLHFAILNSILRHENKRQQLLSMEWRICHQWIRLKHFETECRHSLRNVRIESSNDCRAWP